ncbi:MAG: hypothetical protein ACRCV9_14830 [Burkholderiaceae bacterium]
MPADSTLEAKYKRLAASLLKEPGVTPGSGKKGFGSNALHIHGKIFAMLTPRGEFVVKLDRARVLELVAAGHGTQFDAGHGRLMKEWFALGDSSSLQWLRLAREALAYVASQSKAV